MEVEFAGLAADVMDAVAAEMVERAHQLANRPQFECDVDVSVQVTPGRGAPPGREPRGERVLSSLGVVADAAREDGQATASAVAPGLPGGPSTSR